MEFTSRKFKQENFAGSKVATKKTIGKVEEKIIQFVGNEEEEEIQQIVKENFNLNKINLFQFQIYGKVF